MGMATNILIFVFCLSFVMWIFGYSTLLTEIIGCFQMPGSELDSSFLCPSGSGVWGTMWGVLTLGAAAAIVTGSILVFGTNSTFSIIGLGLFAFATFPIWILNDATLVPSEIKVFLGGIYMICYALALISWQKSGGGTP